VKVGELADSATSNAVKLHRSSGKLRKLYMYRLYIYRSSFGHLLDGGSFFLRTLGEGFDPMEMGIHADRANLIGLLHFQVAFTRATGRNDIYDHWSQLVES